MRNTKRSRGVIVISVMLASASAVFAQDWPQWRGVNRDGKVTGFTVPATWPESFNQKWSTNVGSGDATPALVGGRLYVFTRQGEDETVLCLNAADGSQFWETKYAAQAVTGPAGRHPGPRSSPAVSEGRIVTLGVGGVVSCLDCASGKLLWQKDPFPKVVPTFFTSMSPLIIEGAAIVHLGAKGNGALIAYELDTGDEKWRWGEEGPEYASPALLTVGDSKQVVTLAEQSVVAIDAADGKLLWKLPFAPARRAYNAATPIIDGQTVIYTGAGRGTFCVKVEQQDGRFEANELWSNPDLAPQYNTPVLKDGLLFGLSNGGNLFCIDAQTGQTKWIDETSRDRSGFGAVVDAGSALLALPSGSELVAFAPSGDKFSELARIKVAESSVYAHPLLAGSQILVKDQETLTMWSIE